MNNIIILATFIVAFFVSFYAYRKGLQDGLSIKKDKPIEPIIKHVTKQPEKPMDELTRGILNILAYDGTEQEEKK